MSRKILSPAYIFLLYFAISGCRDQPFKEISLEKAAGIHRSLLTIDSHTDTPLTWLPYPSSVIILTMWWTWWGSIM
jgi:hypothetical protein